MSQEKEVSTVLSLLAGARLRNAPTVGEVAQVKQTWLKMMGDLPDGLLSKAATEHILTGDFWPTPAEIRKLAWKVNLKGGTAQPYANTDKTTVTVDWCAHITPDGWYAHTYDLARPGRPPTAYEDALSRYPEECTADERAMVEQEYQKRNGEPPLLPPGWEGECSTSSAN